MTVEDKNITAELQWWVVKTTICAWDIIHSQELKQTQSWGEGNSCCTSTIINVRSCRIQVGGQSYCTQPRK